MRNGAGQGSIVTVHRGGEYAQRGDYHREADPTWSYYPTYQAKMALVRAFLDRLPQQTKLLDAGCGEGVLVEDYAARDYCIWGLDINYGSPRILRGDVLALPFCRDSFEVVLLLDVLEHLALSEQPRALAEAHRVLCPGGHLAITVPNLAHLASRLRFLLRGQLSRTASLAKHPGDRPIGEYLALVEETGFRVEERRGITLSLPLITSRLIWRHPQRFLWLHDLLQRIARPGWSWENWIVARKE